MYGRTLTVVLRYSAVTLLILMATIALNVYLFVRVPKGFFPQQDNGRMGGAISGRSGHVLPGHGQDPAANGGYRRKGSRRGQRQWFHGRQPDQHRPHVYRFEAARREKDQRGSGHPAAAAEAGAGARRDAVSAGLAGPARRRTQHQRAVSIHDARRQPKRFARLCAADAEGASNRAYHHRREQRSAGQGTASHGRVRPADGGALRHLAAIDRQHPLRCLRAAASLHHVHAAESISRGHGSRAGMLAESRDAEPDLRAGAQRAGGAAERVREIRAPDGAACR